MRRVLLDTALQENEPECFCRLCGQEFARAVADSLDRTITEGVETYA
jgi:hypothetical protein